MGNQLSLRTIKECFYPMTTAEAVSAVHYSMTSLAATPDGTREVKCAVSYTDDNFGVYLVSAFCMVNLTGGNLCPARRNW